MCKLKIGICLFYDFFGYILSRYFFISRTSYRVRYIICLDYEY